MSLSMALVSVASLASAQDIKFAWNPNPEANIQGYVVSYGTESGNLTESLDVGNKTTATLTGLQPGVMHYASLQAYNTAGLFSQPTAELSFTPTIKPPVVVYNQAGIAQPGAGGSLDLGMVLTGAIGETQTFTFSNTGTTTLTGLRFEIDAATASNFMVSGLPVTPVILRNASFEQNLTHWSGAGAVTTATSSAASNGASKVKFNADDQASTGVISQSFATTPGMNYRINYDVAVEATNTKEQTLRTTILGNQLLGEDVFTLIRPIQNQVTWTTRSMEFTADSTRTTLRFEDESTLTLRVDLLLDNIRLTAANAPAAAQTVPAITLAPGKSATFSVSYKPSQGGSQEASLVLVADQVSTALYQVNLKGTASVSFDRWLADYNAQGGAAGNQDMDALGNLQEYAFGTDPKKAQGVAVSGETGKMILRGSPAARVLPAGQGGFQGMYARRKDRAAMNLHYTAQFSADLAVWVNATATPAVLGDDGEMELVAVGAPTSINGRQPRFFRVGTHQNAPPTYAEWLALANPAGGDQGNPDGDALINMQEYAFGTDPKVGNGRSVSVIDGLIASRGAPAARVIQGSAPEFHGMFARRKTLGFDKYRPQFSADLIQWVDSTSAPVKLADDGEMEVLSVAAPASIDGKPARFFRVGTLK